MKNSDFQSIIFDRKALLGKLENYISNQRYTHTLGVEETALKMARIFGVDEAKASLAALLHDIAKELKQEVIVDMATKIGWVIGQWEKNQPRELLHAPASAYLASTEFGIKDEEILGAITYHTLGKEEMSPLEMIIFVADMVEPHRSFPGIEDLRQAALVDLKNATLACLEHTLSYLQDKNIEIHPQTSRTYANLKKSR